MEINAMDQLDLFSQADEHLEAAHQALLKTDFSAARKELEIARSINPFLANLDATAHVVEYFVKFFKKAQSPAEALAAVFKDIPQAVRKNTLLIREADLVEQMMARMAISHVKATRPFVDSGKVLHWGSCYTLTRQFSKAEKVFKETLESVKEQRADLWGYYADLCYLMSDPRQAQRAYVRSLLIDPQAIDLYRIKLPGLKQLYLELREQHKEAEARSLLLFEAWSRELLVFSQAGRSHDPLAEPFRAMLKKALPKDKAGRLHRFSLYLYIDQMNARVDVKNREKMQAIDKALFNRYLELLQNKE